MFYESKFDTFMQTQHPSQLIDEDNCFFLGGKGKGIVFPLQA
jgi:hypothetical protein